MQKISAMRNDLNHNAFNDFHAFHQQF